MKNRIFVKLGLGTQYVSGTSKDTLREIIAPESVAASVAMLPLEKRVRLEAGERFTLIVKVGTRKRLLKWQLAI